MKDCEAKESINKDDTIEIVPIDLRFNHIEIWNIHVKTHIKCSWH